MTEDLEDVIRDVEPVADAKPEGEQPKKSFPSDVVKKVVDREKAKAYERGKREALMELQQQAPQAPEQQAPAPQQLGGMAQMSQADIERMISERAPLPYNSMYRSCNKTKW